MLQIEIPEDKEKIIKHIKALKWQLMQDTNDKDKQNTFRSFEMLREGV